MSPLWRDEVGVHLSERRVCLVRLGRGLKPKFITEHEQACMPKTSGDWAAALTTVDGLLGQTHWQNAGLRIVVADCWVRYALVPWATNLRSAEERLGHARQLLASIYGEAVGGWEVQVSDAPPKRGRVACVMPEGLLEALRGLAAKHAVPLLSLQPQLIAAYQHWRPSLPESLAWFVTIGDGTLSAARIGQGSWDRLHSVRIGHDWLRDLKRLQVFARLANASAGEGAVYVDAPHAWCEVAGPDGKDLHWLEEEGLADSTLARLARFRRMAA